MSPVTSDLDSSHAVAIAEETGEVDELSPENRNHYEITKKAKDPATFAAGYAYTYGVDGSYEKLYNAYHKGLLLTTAYQGLPTKTMQMKGDVLNDTLNTAMVKVVLGDGIEVFDQAVETWKLNGGDDLTKEVNEWYSLKK